MTLSRETLIQMMKDILARQGRPAERLSNGDALREVGFRSLDFSELCVRVEEKLGRELNFEAAALRRIVTVKDACDFVLDSDKAARAA